MALAIPEPQDAANLFGPPEPGERFAGLDAGALVRSSSGHYAK